MVVPVCHGLSKASTKINSSKKKEIPNTSAGFMGGPKGPGPRAPHHVKVFSHMCDMCVSLSHF